MRRDENDLCDLSVAGGNAPSESGKLCQACDPVPVVHSLSLGGNGGDGRSVLSILILCASLGATLEIEASGPDEREAIQAVDAFFESRDE